MNIQIRQAIPADAESIVKINRDCWIETYPNPEYGVYKEDIIKKFENLEEMVNKTSENIKLNNIGKFVAVDGNNIIGYTITGLIDNRNLLKAMYIKKEYQGKGVGRLLMNEVLNFNKNNLLFLTVAVYNENAIKFYKKHGFEFVKNSENNHEIIPGKYIPIIEMNKKV